MGQQIVKHPSSHRVESEAYSRLDKLRKQHEAATNRAWLGALVTFTDAELQIIGGSLCPNDYALLKLAGRKLVMPKAVRQILND